MAARRNVPSKEAYRVIKGRFDEARTGFLDFNVNTKLSIGGYPYGTARFLKTKPLLKTWPLGSNLHRRGAFLSRLSAATHERCLVSKSYIRCLSTSRKLNTPTLADRSALAEVSSHSGELGSSPPDYTFFPKDFSTDPGNPIIRSGKEKGNTDRQLDNSEEDFVDEIEYDTSTIPTNSSEDMALAVPPYIAHGQPIPLYIPHVERNYAKTIRDDRDPRHEYLYKHILSERDKHGKSAAIRKAGEILKCYVDTNIAQDWILAKQLYISLCYRFTPADLRKLRNSLVRSMLQESPPRQEAVSLLVEKVESDRETNFRHVHSYLTEFCELHPDLGLQLVEAEKIMRTIREYPEFRTTHVLLPLVRYAVIMNDPDHARDLTARFHRTCGLSISLSVTNEIIKGYARQGNMAAIDELLADLHHQGVSRSKPYGFAALVRSVFIYLAPVRDNGRMFDFLTYSTCNHGLVPTTTLTASVARNFVATRRHDLLRRWIHMQQTRFPDTVNPVGSPLAAYEMNDAWTHMVATPYDVLATCRSLAYGTSRNPFGEEFRHMTNRFVASSLNRLSKEFVLKIGITEDSFILRPSSNTEETLEHCNRLVKFHSTRKVDVRNSLLVETFAKKVAAAREAIFLVNHFSEYIQQHGPVLGFEEQGMLEVKPVKRHVFAPTAKMPRNVERLMDQKLATMMLKNFEDAQSLGDRDRRNIVVDTVRYLQRAQRHRDCAILIREFWRSGHVDGAFFTHELIKSWVKMSYELRSAKLLHEALWAAIDSDPAHIIGYRFLTLIRAAVSVVTEEIEVGRLQQYPNQLEELSYLVSRCYRRRWQQEHCSETKDIKDPWLKRWKEEQDRVDAPFKIRYEYVL